MCQSAVAICQKQKNFQEYRYEYHGTRGHPSFVSVFYREIIQKWQFKRLISERGWSRYHRAGIVF
jgi:hypothetical protein